MTDFTLHVGDCREILRTLPDNSVQCCVTSPPYYRLRDYGVDGQMGLEETPEEFLDGMVSVFREVRRVLRSDGTCWVNMGDSYAGAAGGAQGSTGQRASRTFTARVETKLTPGGLAAKQLMGMPWRPALALQADGWWLRQDIIWSKPNPMPESSKDRCTKSHEYIFLLTKSARYYWDQEAMREPVTGNSHPRGTGLHRKLTAVGGWASGAGSHHAVDHNRGIRSPRPKQNRSFSEAVKGTVEFRNKRSVWTVPTEPCADAHFATYPSALIKPCILAGTRPGDTVLDPFGGSGTTGQAALELGRKAVLIELNPEYAALIRRRTTTTPGLGI